MPIEIACEFSSYLIAYIDDKQTFDVQECYR